MRASGTIIVTGASRGIGASTALGLARRGFVVACLSRSGTIPPGEEPGDEALGARMIALRCDVTDEAGIKDAFKSLAERGNGIIGLVNNAGVHWEGRARSLPTSDLEAILRTNTVAPFVAAREIYPYLVAAGGGLIVNIGSFFGRLAAKGSIAYCASKAALEAMTRVLAAEWGRKGIAVLNIAPGYIETDVNRKYLADPASRAMVSARNFVGRPGRTDEVARLVCALYSENIPFLTGETIYIDGGHSVAL